jgi:hypothetical protein
MFGDREILEAEECFGRGFIHAHGRSQDCSADIRDIGQFEKTLDRPVFTTRTMENRKIDVRLRISGESILFPGEEGRELSLVQRLGRKKGRVDNPPSALLTDEDGDDIVFFFVQVFVDGGRRDKGDFVFGRASPEEQSDSRFFRVQRPENYCKRLKIRCPIMNGGRQSEDED